MMGNCSSEHQHHSRLFRAENFSNDPSAFRVFVKKRNKFIPGWLKINDDEIVFCRGGNNFQSWPLAHLRRYGYTCSGVFFFESGRRCATGEGLHTFQSHQAERIFHMVQSKIKIEEYARCGSRAGSVASSGAHRIHSLVPNAGASARIHPIQRFSSEGANNEFAPPASAADSVPPPSAPPPPYSAYAVSAASDTRRMRQNESPTSNCPSLISAVSSSTIPQHFVRSMGGPMAEPPALSRDRPRSVVSNIEHGVVLNHRLPHSTSATASHHHHHQHSQAVAATQPLPTTSFFHHHHHRPPPNVVTNSNSSSSLMTIAAIMQHQQQQQHHANQHNANFALPPSALNALAASASGSCLMNQSFHSVLDSTGGVSPWASQQQLEGEIVLEHVLGIDSRRRLTPSLKGGGHSPNNAAESIRVAVPPPPRPPLQQQMQQQPRLCRTADGSSPAYVNVEFGVSTARHSAADGANGNLPEEIAKQQHQLNVRELHRTDHSRLEFLSTGPGAFMLSSSYGPLSMSTSMVASASPSSVPHGDAMVTAALPPALLHQHQQHNVHHQQLPQCLHHSFYATGRGGGPSSAGAAHNQQQHQMMSASVCGTLPTIDNQNNNSTNGHQPGPPLLLAEHQCQQQTQQQTKQQPLEGDDGAIIGRCNTYPSGPIILLSSPNKLMGQRVAAAIHQQQQPNPPLSNTTTASSTPS